MIKVLLFIAIVLLLMRSFRWPGGGKKNDRPSSIGTSHSNEIDDVQDAVFKDLN